MKKLLDEMQMLQQELIDQTQCKCVLALMLSENIDFDIAAAKLRLADAAMERIQKGIKSEVM